MCEATFLNCNPFALLYIPMTFPATAASVRYTLPMRIRIAQWWPPAGG
jgi:hypothetical protein